MYFQVEKIILWPRKVQYNYKTIDFSLEKVNVITGASRTGKSAIIPIIDYCLGESKCQIPVNIIRDACVWFGIVIKLMDRRILLARREPEEQKSTDDMMILEGEEIIIPQNPYKNVTRKNVCKYLDEISKISFLDLGDVEKSGFNERPSFRDMLAFCFQAQNIIANANTLFYKADTTEHRNKLINIFPYVLGAITPEILAKKQELDELEKRLKRKERELIKIQEVSERWKIEISGWINAAKEYGLVSLKYPVESLSFEGQLDILKEISQKSSNDMLVLKDNIEEASKEIIALRKKENKLSLELSQYKSRYLEMTQFVDSIDEYRKTLSIQADRLSVSRWMRELSDQNGICPFCGSKHNIQERIDTLVCNLEEIERESEGLEEIPVAFEREYSIVQGEISKLTEKISSIQKRIKIQYNVSDKSYEQKYTLENISRFLGKVQYAEETYRAIGLDGELQTEIANLKSQIEVLRQEVDEVAIKRKFNAALKNIQLKIMKLLPMLDVERPQDNVEIDYKNLTISVTGENGRKDYLWEIGSGSNWLSYHMSVSLAFQMFFSEQKMAPVPQFLVYDQPSQVYFPRKMAQREDETNEEQELTDEDIIAVKKLFSTMSNALKQTTPHMQIIVLEHASENAWEGVEGIYLVDEWRGENKKLIPEEWIIQ